MKLASKLLALSTFLAVANFSSTATAAPSGPSARAAARLKKYPTSRWLAHYLPDDRYKIAGGVWKYVSTDLDTYYHRPNSPLMMRQPAGRVIGFASAAEAEEAGYRAGPGAQQANSGFGASATTRSASVNNSEMRKVLGVLRELQSLGDQIDNEKGENLPLLKQRLQRMLVLLNDIPVDSRASGPMNRMKIGLRGFVKAIDLHNQGNSEAAAQQLLASLATVERGSREFQQLGSTRRRR